jgi:peptide/nickel transport system substrate-binding protein/oligopeptide transport system substrate-binding protein
LHAGVVALIAVSLGVVGTYARTSHRTSHASLQTLRFVNYVASDLSLAASLDPAYISAAADYTVVQLTHVGLVQNLPTGKVAKQLASKITVSGGGKVYTFQMHHWKFFNGHAITAADVVWSIKRALKAPGTEVNYYDEDGYGDIKGADAYAGGKSSSLPGVKALGKYTVQITITHPIAYFLQALTYPINMPLDPTVAGRQPASANNNYLTQNCPAARADSSGQFTFQCSGSGFYASGQTPRYTLVPNPKFAGHKAHLKLILSVVGVNTTEYNQYLAGSLDLSGIPAQFLPQWKSNPRGQLFYGPQCPKPTSGCPSTSILYLQVNTKTAPWDNLNCRLALAWGLNRPQEAKIYNGSEKPLYTITPGGLGIMTPKAVASIASKVPRFNLSKAKSYAAKCPAANKSASFTDVYATGSTTATALALEQVKEMQDLGFTGAQSKGLPQNEWLTDDNTAMSKTGVGMIRSGWLQDYSDPQDYVSLLFDCGATYNIGEFCDRTFTNMTSAADVNHNVRARTQQYLNAQVRILNEGYPIMLFNPAIYGLIKPYVHGLSYSVADGGMEPANNDWSKVTLSKH